MKPRPALDRLSIRLKEVDGLRQGLLQWVEELAQIGAGAHPRQIRPQAERDLTTRLWAAGWRTR